jgi:hypothetical protein
VGFERIGDVLEIASFAFCGKALGYLGGGHFGLFVCACIFVVDEAGNRVGRTLEIAISVFFLFVYAERLGYLFTGGFVVFVDDLFIDFEGVLFVYLRRWGFTELEL